MGRKRKTTRFPKRYCTIDFLLCYDYNERGQGIVAYKDKCFYIEGLIKGEKARILIFYEYPENGYGRAIMLENISPQRKLPLNHPKLELGIYQLAHLTDEAQDEFKQNRLQNVFKMSVNPIIVGKRSYYRNKVVLSDGGFKPLGRRRKYSIIPTREQFDLMDIDFSKYTEFQGDLIIRRLDEEIQGVPGEDKFTTDHFLNKVFHVNLNSFYQVNSEMAQLVYQKIMEFIPKNVVVFDLFAGVSTIAICVSDKAKHVYSVEIYHQNYKDTLINLELNNVKNVIPICDDVNKWLEQTKIKPHTIIVDPARSGLSQSACNVINNSQAEQIIYLSCNIYTQKRDIDLLTNYQIIYFQAYDFFPQTYHIENLIVLKKYYK